MTVHVSGRSISALLLLSVSLWGCPRMQWDDPLEKYLPEFKLAERTNDPNDRATLHDVLSHRTRFTRMAFLEINRGLSEIMTLRRIPVAAANAILRTTGSVQVERVEAGAELAPDTFTLEPSAASVRKR